MKPKMPKTPFAMSLSGSAKETELRIRNIFQWEKKRPPIILMILFASLLLCICGGLVSFSNQQSSNDHYLALLEVSGATVYAERQGLWSFDVYWKPNGGIAEHITTATRAKASSVELTEHSGKLAVRYTDSYNDLSCIRVFALFDDKAPEYLCGGASDSDRVASTGMPSIEEILGLVENGANDGAEFVTDNSQETEQESMLEVEGMTTSALLTTVLDYPFLVDLLAFDSLQMGIDSVSNHFPGLPEFLSREDAAQTLEDYLEISVSGEDDSDIVKRIYAQTLAEYLENDGQPILVEG